MQNDYRLLSTNPRCRSCPLKPNSRDTFNGLTEHLILELLYQTGMRRAELLNLRFDAVQLSQRTLKVLGKGNKERILPLVPAIIPLIQEYINERSKIPTHIPTTSYF